MMCAILWYIGPRYNDTRLYFPEKFRQDVIYHISQWKCCCPSQFVDCFLGLRYWILHLLIVISNDDSVYEIFMKWSNYRPPWDVSPQLEIICIFRDDVIKLRPISRHWPFVRGIHWSPEESPYKKYDAELWCFLWSGSEKRSNKESRRRWFETPSRSPHHWWRWWWRRRRQWWRWRRWWWWSRWLLVT